MYSARRSSRRHSPGSQLVRSVIAPPVVQAWVAGGQLTPPGQAVSGRLTARLARLAWGYAHHRLHRTAPLVLVAHVGGQGRRATKVPDPAASRRGGVLVRGPTPAPSSFSWRPEETRSNPMRQTSLEPDPTPTPRAAAVGRTPVAVTGIQASGRAHLGNLLGLIRPALALAASSDAHYFIADAHALTTLRDGAALRRHTREIAATWLALGLDPHRTTLYRQSDLPEVFELAWILACYTGKGLLNRAHAYKAAVAANRAAGRADDHGVTGGIFGYPVLMAADILLLAADVVPVGLDQQQHVEIAREIGASFNAVHGRVLTLPEPLIDRRVATIPGSTAARCPRATATSCRSSPSRTSCGGWSGGSSRTRARRRRRRTPSGAPVRALPASGPAGRGGRAACPLPGGRGGLPRGQGGAGRAAGCGLRPGQGRLPGAHGRSGGAGATPRRRRRARPRTRRPVIDRVRAAVGLG